METPNDTRDAPRPPWSVDLLSRQYILAVEDDKDFVDLLFTYALDPKYSLGILSEEWVTERLVHIAEHNAPIFNNEFLRVIEQYFRGESRANLLGYLADAKKRQNGLHAVPLSSIEKEDITWLWEPYIPLGKVTLIEGDPSVGKTFLVLMLCAALTRGFALPDQNGHVGTPDPSQARNILYLTAEDGLADTIRPRAEKLGADLDRFFVIPHEATLALDHASGLAEVIKTHEAAMVVFDPLQAFLGAEMDMHRANEVRPFMTLLGDMATQLHCAMVANRHWTKTAGGKARYRGQGNIDFVAAARSVLSVGESPEDEYLRIMAHAKSSLSRIGRSLMFQISDDGFTWAGTSELTADELAQMQPNKRQHQRKAAVEWLKDYLKDGPQPSQAILAAGQAVGIAERTMWRAKEVLGILVGKDKGKWHWRLPTFARWDRHPESEDDGIEV